MGLKEGTLHSLLEHRNDLDVSGDVFHQMLQALDYLATENIVHRDVKPENILYITQANGKCQFQLGDFGLSNNAATAWTTVGTPLFMAPEVYQGGHQTPKVDIWSLFVTMLWILDIGGFRQWAAQFKGIPQIHDAVLCAARSRSISHIQEMAIYNPEERASAAQVLVKCFNGEGLTTPPDQVPPYQHAQRSI